MKNLIIAFFLFSTILVKGQNSSVVHANNSFAFNLFEKLSAGNKNMVICPYSISVAMAMLYNGAWDDTKEEIRKVFLFEEDDSKFLKNFQYVFNQVDKSNIRGVQFNNGNYLYCPEDLNLNTSFKNTNAEYYSMEVKASEEDLFRIIKMHSNNLISNIEGNADSIHSCLLINNFYFYGNWATEFDRADTKLAKFYMNDKQFVEVDYMNLNGKYNFFQNDKLKTIEIPYSNNGASMVIIIPTMSGELNLLDYQQAMAGSQPLQISLSVPRFRYQTKISLNEILKSSGIRAAFTDSSNFSNFTDSEIILNSVFHQAAIEVNEKGTEAAAITTLKLSGTITASDYPSFNVERPFFYIVKDNINNSILYIGQLSNPAE